MSDLDVWSKLKEPFPAEDIALIPLSQGEFALVDPVDLGLVSQWKWHFDGRYAARDEWPSKKKIYLHRALCQGKEVDHINRNKLDCRRSNLRSVDRTRNNLNAPIRVDNSSGHKGVYKSRNGHFYARISFHGVTYQLGTYTTFEEAVTARKGAEGWL